MSTLLATAYAAFDHCNAAEPVSENGMPRALLYGQRMSAQLVAFCPAPTLALQLAARAQHLQRGQIGREQFSSDRAGYRAWRNACAEHALINRVGQLIRKQNLNTDTDAQTLEDITYPLFLRHEIAAFLIQKPGEKTPVIVRKTWAKMSSAGQQAALNALPTLPNAVQQSLSTVLPC